MWTWEANTILIIALFWLLCASVSAFLASNRGKNSLLWFALGLLLGPFAFIGAVWPKGKGNG
mgnify:CR=1 FL=1